MTKTDLKASGLEVIGYRGIFPNRGKYIPADEALEYALEQCGVVVDARAPAAREFLAMLPEWFSPATGSPNMDTRKGGGTDGHEESRL